MLAAENRQVIAWYKPSGTPPRVVGGVTWRAVDLLDRKSVATELERIRPVLVYHCAGAAHVGRSWRTTETAYAVNVRGTHNVIEGLHDAEISARVLIPSSSMVYAASNRRHREEDPTVPTSPYGLSKLAQELLSVDPERPNQCSIARAFNHIGPRQDHWFAASGFARRIAELEASGQGGEISVGNLEARRDLTDVRDTVRAYRLILERGAPGRTYNVCSGRAVAIGEILEMLLARSKVRVTAKVDPGRYRPNDIPLVLGDPTRINEELGWSATIPLAQSIEDILQFWRARIVTTVE